VSKRIALLAVCIAGCWAQPPVNPRPFRLNELHTPAGFEINIFAALYGAPRLMTFGPNGVLYVALRDAGTIAAVPSRNQIVAVLQGLNGPHSVAFRGSDLYVAVNDGVLRFHNAVTPDLIVNSASERLVTLPGGGQHTSRTAAIGPDDQLYVTVGSTCNFCREDDPQRAVMLRYDLEGANSAIIARGMRNSVDFAWHPLTGELWALDNGGDGLGDDEPPEEINVIEPGGDYGWPDCVGAQRAIDWGDGLHPEYCANTRAPEQEMQAHSAPLGIAFYTGAQFPASYLNDAFVAFHGSWNREEPTGYKVVRVHAASGRATGVEDFLWGFLDLGSRTDSGRPVDPVMGPDGALYVSDDSTGNIYRIAYTGPRISPGGIADRGDGVFDLYGSNLVNDPAALAVFANTVPCEVVSADADHIVFRLPDEVTGNITIIVRNEKAQDSAHLTR
jgi:glucose/arabinose dehydrogenase